MALHAIFCRKILVAHHHVPSDLYPVSGVSYKPFVYMNFTNLWTSSFKIFASIYRPTDQCRIRIRILWAWRMVTLDERGTVGHFVRAKHHAVCVRLVLGWVEMVGNCSDVNFFFCISLSYSKYLPMLWLDSLHLGYVYASHAFGAQIHTFQESCLGRRGYF